MDSPQEERPDDQHPPEQRPDDPAPLGHSAKERAEDITRELIRKGEQDTGVSSKILDFVLKKMNRAISDADQQAAILRVQTLHNEQPQLSVDELVEELIKKKCQQTAAVGIATSSAGFIPGLGTIASTTLGVAADIGATFKLQAELVLEVAAAHRYEMSELEKRQAILLITGISSSGTRLINEAGKRVALRFTEEAGERVVQKWVTHALPFVGVAASAATNVLSTYIIGQRAHAYFGRGELQDWTASLRAIVGLDERKIGSWAGENAGRSWNAVSGGAQRTAGAVAGAGKATGNAVGGAVGKAAGTVATTGGAIAGTAAKAGSTVLNTVGGVASAAKRGVTGAFRKIGSFFSRGKKQ